MCFHIYWMHQLWITYWHLDLVQPIAFSESLVLKLGSLVWNSWSTDDSATPTGPSFLTKYHILTYNAYWFPLKQRFQRFRIFMLWLSPLPSHLWSKQYCSAHRPRISRFHKSSPSWSRVLAFPRRYLNNSVCCCLFRYFPRRVNKATLSCDWLTFRLPAVTTGW